MPYAMYKSGKKFCVKNSDTGESRGCSDTRAMAVAHMRALYAAHGGAKMGKKELEEIEAEIKAFNEKYPPTDEELAELKELGLIDVILGKEEGDEEDDKDEPKEDASESEHKPKGLRARFDAAILKLKQALFDEEEHPQNLMVWHDKEADQWRWIARYSNNFRDRDNPPEIISQDSHRRFVDRVEKGLAPYPELWLWHVPEWKIGQSTWVAYDDSGFAMSAGYFFKGTPYTQVAEWLSKQSDFLTSHGMPPHTIERDSSDQSVIINHDTREISPLPGKFAANTLTGFYVEDTMAIPEAKKKALVDQWGLPAETLDALERINSDTAKEAENKGLERKEETPAEETTPPAEEPKTEVPEEKKEEAPTEPAPENKEAVLDSPPTRQEIADAFAAILVPLVDQVKSLSEKVGDLQAKFDAKDKTAEQLATEKIKETPLASLAALMTQRVIGNPETQIDGRTELAKSHPKETQPREAVTGIPFIDSMLSKQQE